MPIWYSISRSFVGGGRDLDADCRMHASRALYALGCRRRCRDRSRRDVSGLVHAGAGAQFAMLVMASALRGTGIVPHVIGRSLPWSSIYCCAGLIAGWGTGLALGVAGAGLASSIAGRHNARSIRRSVPPVEIDPHPSPRRSRPRSSSRGRHRATPKPGPCPQPAMRTGASSILMTTVVTCTITVGRTMPVPRKADAITASRIAAPAPA